MAISGLSQLGDLPAPKPGDPVFDWIVELARRSNRRIEGPQVVQSPQGWFVRDPEPPPPDFLQMANYGCSGIVTPNGAATVLTIGTGHIPQPAIFSTGTVGGNPVIQFLQPGSYVAIVEWYAQNFPVHDFTTDSIWPGSATLTMQLIGNSGITGLGEPVVGIADVQTNNLNVVIPAGALAALVPTNNYTINLPKPVVSAQPINTIAVPFFVTTASGPPNLYLSSAATTNATTVDFSITCYAAITILQLDAQPIDLQAPQYT